MDKNKILEGLQIIVTDLAQQADGRPAVKLRLGRIRRGHHPV